MKVDEYFRDADTRSLFEQNGLGGFESLWRLEAPWFESPNAGRDGVSGVLVHRIEDGSGNTKRVFVKRQENHRTRNLRHPLRGLPTFAREFHNIRRLSALGIPTIEVLYFGTAEDRGQSLAILVSEALDDYLDLDVWLSRQNGTKDRRTVYAMIDSVIPVIRRIHDLGYRHGCLYGKHIFLRPVEGADGLRFDVRLLDFEKAHRPLRRRHGMLRDLSQFIRHSRELRDEEVQYFVQRYFGEGSFPDRDRLMKHVKGKPRTAA